MKDELSTGENSLINENLSFINFEKVDLLCYRKLASVLGKLPVKYRIHSVNFYSRNSDDL